MSDKIYLPGETGISNGDAVVLSGGRKGSIVITSVRSSVIGITIKLESGDEISSAIFPGSDDEYRLPEFIVKYTSRNTHS